MKSSNEFHCLVGAESFERISINSIVSSSVKEEHSAWVRAKQRTRSPCPVEILVHGLRVVVDGRELLAAARNAINTGRDATATVATSNE